MELVALNPYGSYAALANINRNCQGSTDGPSGLCRGCETCSQRCGGGGKERNRCLVLIRFVGLDFATKHLLVFPSKMEWDLTNGPLSKLLELLDTQV